MAVDIEEDVFIVGVGVPMISFEIGKNLQSEAKTMMIRNDLKSTTLQRRAEWLIILNSKAHLIWPKSAQKGAQFFSPKSAFFW